MSATSIDLSQIKTDALSAASTFRTLIGLGTLATQSPTGTANNTTYLRGDFTWQTISSGGTWGSITGTLSSQTDLQSALDAKASLTGATFTGRITTPSVLLSGNYSAAAWTTSGVGLSHTARTLTDTSSSGTVAAAYTNVLGGNTIAASSSTTFTEYASLYIGSPTAGSNVTVTNAYSLITQGAVKLGGQLTLTQGTANSSVFTSTGYSLTGSNAQSLIDLAGTWNTTGTPTAIKLNVTDTASNASSLLMDLQVGGASKFKVSKSGSLIGNAATLSATLDLTIRTVTYGATMAIDAALGNKIAITLTGNGTISNPTNAVDGRVLVFRLRQDGSGNRVPVWDTKYSFVGDLATVLLSTAANKIDRVAFEYDSTDDKWYCISFIKGS